MDEFPSMADLFDFLSNGDDSWGELERAYFYISELVGKCMGELYKKPDIKNIEKTHDIADYKYYTGRFLFRSFRIYKSIVLLSIYDQWLEAQMISRSLLDNIAEAKYFINNHRGKSIKLIKLYEFSLNTKKDYESIHSQDVKNVNKNGYIILSKCSIDYKERLRQEVAEGLSKYSEVEVMKMKENIKYNRSWHGLSRHKLYMDVGMQDCYRDYKDSCKIVHIAEENPFAILNDKTEFASKGRTCGNSMYMLRHMRDFNKLCPITFTSLEVINALNGIGKSLEKLFVEEIRKHAPSILDPYKVT